MIARGLCIVNKHLFNALGKNKVGTAATRRRKYELKLKLRKIIPNSLNSNKKKTEPTELLQSQNLLNISNGERSIKTIVPKKPIVHSISKERKHFNSVNNKSELDLESVNEKLQLWKSQQDENEEKGTSLVLVIRAYLRSVEDFRSYLKASMKQDKELNLKSLQKDIESTMLLLQSSLAQQNNNLENLLPKMIISVKKQLDDIQIWDDLMQNEDLDNFLDCLTKSIMNYLNSFKSAL